MHHALLRCGDRTFALGERTLVMGIVNVTPDSFSDGGEFFTPVAAYDHSMRLLEAGADVLDLGAESTRPGAVPIDADEESRRLLPVLDRLVAAGVRCTSIDTSKASVARLALAHGASWINDVSGLADPDLAAAAADADALVVMHQRPMSPSGTEDHVAYDDLLGEVTGQLGLLVERATSAGVAAERIVVDPGIGFGKTIRDNLELIARLDVVRAIGHPVLVGPSRKRFLAALSGAESVDGRDDATVGACCAAALRGADIVRVHRVDGLRAALAIVDAIRRSTDVP